MKLDKYRGIIPAFYACYDRAGEVSVDGVRALTCLLYTSLRRPQGRPPLSLYARCV